VVSMGSQKCVQNFGGTFSLKAACWKINEGDGKCYDGP
jgi:hypothetical protein